MKSPKELMEEIGMAKQKYDAVVASGQPTGSARERLKNLLFSYAPDVMEALNKVAQLAEENQVLQVELDDAEAELDALKSESKLKGKKAKVVVLDEQSGEQ